MANEAQAKGAKEAVAKALVASLSEAEWQRVSKALGLTDGAMTDRLVKLLLIQLAMDRLVTGLLALKLTKEDTSDFDAVDSELARTNLSHRIRLAKASRLITDTCADNMHAVNEARNQVSHYQPKLEGGLAGVKAITSDKDFDNLMDRAIGAITEMTEVFGRIKPN